MWGKKQFVDSNEEKLHDKFFNVAKMEDVNTLKTSAYVNEDYWVLAFYLSEVSVMSEKIPASFTTRFMMIYEFPKIIII